jgi:hypothetical protein
MERERLREKSGEQSEKQSESGSVATSEPLTRGDLLLIN